MKKILFSALLSINLLTISAEEVVIDNSITKLNMKTQVSLLEEMRMIKGGMDKLLQYMISGDFEAIQKEAISIRNSFVFVKSLSKEQKQEIGKILPRSFMILDNELHEAANEMANFAEFEDTENVKLYYDKMTNSCIKCHAKFATRRFPNWKDID